MIRLNLSTRPFYNAGAVHVALAALAVVAAAATIFNVTRVVQLSRSDTRLATQASSDEARARQLREGAVTLRASIDPKGLESASNDARQANQLIDRRTFSWTDLFNQFEKTLPPEVRITAVRPSVDQKKGNLIMIAVVARNVDDVNQFMENLEATGAFTGLLARQERVDEQGQLQAILETGYAPRGPQGSHR